MPVLEAHGLVKRFASTVAVAGVSLTVEPAERVALLGPNGAGKTTTLMMLLGVITPDDGWVEVCGHRLPNGRSQALAQVGFSAGYMPLAERLKVHEFLRTYGELYGLSETSGRIKENLDRFRIGHLAETMCTQLSSGQRTLVGMVKATLHEPRLLVLDEPTASLDPEVAQRVRTGLQDLCREEGTALLITSHNMVEIERLCERVVFLSGGRVVADDEPGAIAARYGHQDLEETFLFLASQSEREPAPQETDRMP